jgi:Tol biopolymer transport system component
MKRIIFIVFYCLMISLTISGQEKQPEKLLREAIYQEEIKGNLEEAILIYTDIIKKYPDQRAITVEALYHLGLSNEKLGNKKAQEYYETIVSSFGDQTKYVRIAKERLSKLLVVEKVLNVPLEPKFTKINIPTNLSSSVNLSPDGKDLALVSDKKLWKMPVTGNLGPEFSGIPVQINTEGIEVLNVGLSWSGNGKWIAFNENITKDIKGKGIYIVSSAGGKPNKIVETNRGNQIINYGISLSPDGEKLAFSSVEDKKQYVHSISVDGNNLRQLTDMEAREPVYSPNGKMIAFVEDKNTGTGSGDLGLWVVPTHNGTPHLVANAKKASGPVWSPDSKKIAFFEYNNGKQINIVYDFSDGASPGKVTSIDVPEGIEEVISFAGWTPDNKIGVLLKPKVEFGLYTLPAKGGQPAIVLSEGNTVQPRWSPDSKKIYYINDNNVTSPTSKTLGVVSAEGGKGKVLPVRKDGLLNFPYQWQAGNRISPDGKLIILAATSSKELVSNKPPSTQIWKIPIDGGTPTQITNPNPSYGDFAPSWSPDGNQVAFLRLPLKDFFGKGEDSCEIYTLNIDDRIPKLLLMEKLILSPVWSPDGKLIAYLSYSEDDDVSTINVVNVINGESHMIAEIPPSTSVHTDLAWSPDSKRIAFLDNKSKVVKVVSLSEGSIEDVKTNLVDVKIYHLDWSPDGERFVFGGVKEGDFEFWFLEDFLPLEKLAQKKVAKETPKVMTNKKIWNESDTELEGAPSPDGKYLSYVDWETGDLAIYEIATEKKRRLTNKGSWDKSNEFALMSRWSPDGKQIVYDWKNSNDYCELRIIGIDGSKSRILYANKDVKWTYTYDWSPDGKQILAYFDRKNGNDMISQIVLISVDDGSERILKTSTITKTGQAWPENMCFSTDGQYIIYDFPQKEGSSERDIFMMSTDGTSEIPLVKHPAHDELFGCSPDGRNILFASDRNGTFSLWKIRIAEGKPQGNPELVKSDMGTIEPLGFTQEGSYYYGYSKKNNNMYGAELDPQSGEILSQPKKTITRFEGYNQAPSYSPDGKYLAYISRRFPLTIFPDYTMAKVGGNVLCIKNIGTGEEREIIPGLNRFRSPRWSSDGRSVFVIDMNNNGSKQIDIHTGNVTSVLFDDNLGPQPTERSHDGKTIYYVHHDKRAKVYQILVRNLESGTQKEIYRSDGGLHIRLSPDGQWLAIQENYLGMANKLPTLNIMPSAGGEPRVLYRFEDGIDIRAGAPFTWTTDGKYILYTMKSPKKEIKKWDLYRIPAKGGEPEKLGMEMSGFLMNLSIHPDGRHITFSVT